MTHEHVFDVHKRKVLSSEERQRLLMPRETLLKLGFMKDNTFADIGCGTGLFTFPAAEIGGKSAKIYAVDISQEMLDDVKTLAAEKGVYNIITVKSDDYDFKLDSWSADFILICAVLHEIDDKGRFLAEAKRICRDGGKIAVIEFIESFAGFGPPPSHRLKPSAASGLLTEAGFTNIETFEISEAYYAVAGRG